MTAPAISDDQRARQLLIAGWDQPRLADATVIVAGVGALGNEVLKNLGMLGIGRLIICDPDVVEHSNLSRTVLFGRSDVGRPKVVAAAEALARLAPETTVDTRHDELLHAVGLGELADADLVVGALDSRHARLQLLNRCALADTPLVDGGTRPWGGEVRVRIRPEEACYSCSFGPAERAESDQSARCAGLGGGPEPASILSTAVVAGWMTAAATRILMRYPLPWRFTDVDAASGVAHPFTVARSSDCSMHEPMDRVDLAGMTHDATVERLVASLPDGAEPIAWSMFPLPGICAHCERRYTPEYRDRSATTTCPHCDGWLRPRLSQRVRDADPGTTLRELGVAPAEILAVRLARGGYRWLRLST